MCEKENWVADEDVSSENDDEPESETEEEIEEDTNEDEDENEERFLKTWANIIPPYKEEDVVQKWYRVIFNQHQKTYLYVGKALKRFIDANIATNLEVDCLKLHICTGNVVEEYAPHIDCDIGMCLINDVFFYDTLRVEPMQGGKWKVHDYDNLKEKYNKM